MWTMEELVERVRQALAEPDAGDAGYPGAPNGRVRDVPDRRAIRWYTTIGLVDRPLGMRGRTALYGPRHLKQLVAIKRLQATGRSLAQIQIDFVWFNDEALSDASRVPVVLLEPGDPEPDPPGGPPRTRFWAEAPSTGSPPEHALAHADPARISPTRRKARLPKRPSANDDLAAVTAPIYTVAAPPAISAASAISVPPSVGAAPAISVPPTISAAPTIGAALPDGAARPVNGVTLGGGAILLVPHTVTERDRVDIAAAAAPLLDLLAARGLIDGRTS